MEEIIILKCNKDIKGVEKLLLRAGRYIDQGFVLSTFDATDEGVEVVLTVEEKPPTATIGFANTKEDTVND